MSKRYVAIVERKIRIECDTVEEAMSQEGRVLTIEHPESGALFDCYHKDWSLWGDNGFTPIASSTSKLEELYPPKESNNVEG